MLSPTVPGKPFPKRRWESEAPEFPVVQYAMAACVEALLDTSAGRADLCEKAIQSVKVALIVKLQLYFAG